MTQRFAVLAALLTAAPALAFNEPPANPINLGSQVSGALGQANGGTGASSLGAGTITSAAGLQAASLSARAGWSINPRNYCAVCGDGNSHPVSTTLGVSTLAALANIAAADGSKPFAFVAAYPFGALFNLVPEQTAASGATQLNFLTTATLATQVPIVAAAVSGSTNVIVGDLFTTADKTAVASGTALGGTGIAVGTTVSGAPSGSAGGWTLALSRATTAAISSGGYVIAYVRPAAGAYTIPLVWTSGVNVGDLVTDSGGCVASGSQVDYVNDAKGEIRLSKALAAQCPAQDALTFIPSWLSNVVAGMLVKGPSGAVAANTTVTAVNTSTGVVTLSQALTGSITPNSEVLGNGSPTTAEPVTFYRSFTDAEAAALESDGLALQAAINVTQNATLGGSVDIPNGSVWRLSAPLILPLKSQYVSTQPVTNFGGPPGSGKSVVIEPISDFGPDSAAISCGDPTAKFSNARGLYGTSGVDWCNGELHDLVLKPAASLVYTHGLRPTWNATPVAMDGVKQGNRLNWDTVGVLGFRYGEQAVMDHTRQSNVELAQNFGGLRMDDLQTNLFGDDVLDRFYSSANSQCDLCISPLAYFNGEIRKGYLSTSSYAIYCEPGVAAGQCLQGVTITNLNAENLGCGFVEDGGIQDGFTANGGARTMIDVREINDFHIGPVSGWNDNVPAGGCQWHAYYDVAYDNGHVIDNVWVNDFAPQGGAFAHILRATRLDAYTGAGRGGFTMRGDGVYDVIANARSNSQNVVNGPGGLGGAFWWTGSWRWVTLETANWKARPIPLVDAGATSLPLGSLVEWSTSTLDNVAGVERAGKTAGAAFAGVSLQAWTSSPASLQIAPLIAVAGDNVPFVTTGPATAGEMLIPDTTNLGQAVSTSTVYGPPPAVGLLYGGGVAGLNYGQILTSRP